MSASILDRASAPSRWRRALALLAVRPEVGTETLILAACLYFSLFANAMFWQAAAPRPWTQPVWALSLFLLVTAVHGVWLSLLVWRRTARVVLSVLVVLAALAGHYMDSYGIYIDADMIRNVLHTDWREATDLAGADALLPLLAAVPALVVVWRVRLRARPWPRTLLMRAGFLAGTVVVGLVGVLPSTQPLTAFLRNQREVRYLVTPANVLVSLAKVVSEEPPGRARVLSPISEDAVQSPAATMRRPRVLVLVVGETARAANWGLNGYGRQTTPELARRDVLDFPHVTACGSSTEVSLPCMFSPQGREHYDEQEIRSHQSLLHVLQRAGVATLWRDNQSGCKGVCDGLPVEDLHARTDAGLCDGKRCHDGILLAGLDEAIRRHQGDQVIVLHMLGNHGPNYFERYPPAFKVYQPVCETSDLGRCTRAQIVNAYDNALRYTDHVLAGAIDQLAGLKDYDTALLYVSDHGESLGEKGLYLHGMPYAIAPREQLEVPMVAWFSGGWRASTGLDDACLRRQTGAPHSHDELFHTVLGLTDVKTALYRPDHDIFLTCRGGR
ncbi:phosphoethanolamine--lipid A transferase [Pseudoxanthomonas sp.]|uniref:phosphoethanolamine transferase n=1 Tax=Pseudoxanthomonas sp. TaxID=1871049 RepID=UPI002FE256EC